MNELAIMEALLFAAGEEGLTYKQMADVLDIQEERVYELVQQLKRMYETTERGITVVEMAGTLQLVTKNNARHIYKSSLSRQQRHRCHKQRLKR